MTTHEVKFRRAAIGTQKILDKCKSFAGYFAKLFILESVCF